MYNIYIVFVMYIYIYICKYQPHTKYYKVAEQMFDSKILIKRPMKNLVGENNINIYLM